MSKAGKQQGMAKGGGTRSGMLWEVERILDELNAWGGHLPQVLLMENVPDVIGTKNIQHFAKWLEKLESLGYKCYWQVLNAKDYGIPQNRERCFMVSILGDYYYDFPKRQPLKHKLKDLLEDNVDEKYYLSDKALKVAINTKFNCSKLENKLPKDGIVPTICARDYKDPKCVKVTNLKTNNDCLGIVVNSNNKRLKNLVEKMDLSQDNQFMDIYNQSTSENAGTITTRVDASNSTAVYTNYRIRKLTGRECFRLMGVKDEDFDKIAKNQSNASLYHLAGDSIVINVLMEIFGNMLNVYRRY
jgi:DNA (cytosine-5)-methyltransferase 1